MTVNLDEYCAAFDQARVDFEETVAAFGLPFEAEESQLRKQREGMTCARCENGGASIVRGWLSPACLACRTGEETATFFISLKCTRSCYFCFNVNQEDYDYHRTHERDIAAELRAAHAAGARFRHLAVTGGEPCLHPEALLSFVRCAKELYPGVHVRVYTSGDLLDDDLLDALADAGLNEIRFSVKPEEGEARREETLARIAAAVSRIPDVMVEMPVLPGTVEEMRDLLLRLDELGVRGINLLEFCFPLANAEAFASRGFRLRANPYVIPYNYWYAGGLPIAGSEAACLELVQFADEAALGMGVHYCSLDNKFTGQIYQQNKLLLMDTGFAARHPYLSFDEDDYFLKCAKVFGDDVAAARDVLSPEACQLDEDVPALAFPLALAPILEERIPSADIGVSFNVLEPDEHGAPCVREVALERL